MWYTVVKLSESVRQPIAGSQFKFAVGEKVHD